jgi:predicted transcriptional regulator
MTDNHDQLSNLIRDYKSTPDTDKHEWLIDLAGILGEGMDELGWTQEKLSRESGVPEIRIYNLMNGTQDCTFGVATKLLFALGIKTRIVRNAALR